MSRLSWDYYALMLAWVSSLRSEDPFRKVGACALDFNNRVLGVAYNGVKAGMNISQDLLYDRDKRRPYMLHAEANLLSLFKKDECKTIALTCSPCSSCATLIVANNVKRVIYMSTYDTDTKGEDILQFYNIETVRYNEKDVFKIIQESIPTLNNVGHENV